MPPFLATTDGVYFYNCPANCLRTIIVFIKKFDEYRYSYVTKPYDEFVYQGQSYYSVNVNSQEAVKDTPASLTFADEYNPGTSTSRYYHLYVKKPTEITATNIQLDLPEQVHFDFMDGVSARINKSQYEGLSAWEQWTQRRLPVILDHLNKGAQGFSINTPVRSTYRYYTNMGG